MQVTFLTKPEPVRYLCINGREFRLTRVLPLLKALMESEDNCLYDCQNTELLFFEALAASGLVTRYWKGRLKGHGYGVADTGAFTVFYDRLCRWKDLSDERQGTVKGTIRIERGEEGCELWEAEDGK